MFDGKLQFIVFRGVKKVLFFSLLYCFDYDHV